MKSLLTLFIWLFTALSVPAQDTVVAKVQKDLDAALKRQQETIQQIAGEKIPLVRELDELDDKVAEFTKELKVLQKEESARTGDQVRLESVVKARETEINFIKSNLKEFGLGWPSRIQIAEQQLYEEQLSEIEDRTSTGAASDLEELTERLKLVALSLDRLEDNLGGRTFQGEALIQTGEKVPGRFALLGPAGYFKAQGGESTGVTTQVLNQLTASIVDPGPERSAGIQAVIDGKDAEIALDPTLGKALKLEVSKDTIIEHIAKGQWVGWTLIYLGLFALCIAAFKWWEISRVSVPHPRVVNSIIDHLTMADKKSATEEAARIKGKAGELIQLAVRRHDTKRRVLEELLYEKLLSIRPKLERFLPFLAVTAAAAPLMGLLGTVMGMIKTFKLITEFGTGDARTLSSGISEALVTTELGLVVAIPVLIIHGLLTRMARGRIGNMEAASMAFLNGLTTGDLDKPPPTTPKPKPTPREESNPSEEEPPQASPAPA
ncbi:MAG: biopolymer transport protein ExbB [Pseudoalteromonas tetraodonis]|jgi:biopolymer transport protein ExbB